MKEEEYRKYTYIFSANQALILRKKHTVLDWYWNSLK